VLSKKSELAKAIRYALSNWVALTRYRDDGRIEIDNNAAERAPRCSRDLMTTVSAARRYTRCWAPRNSTISIPRVSRRVLERIADHPINKIDALLPWKAVTQFAFLRLAA
jgi:transposase